MNIEFDEDRQEAILSCWFGHLNKYGEPPEEYRKIWFAKSGLIDQYIRSNFELDIKRAIGGKLKSWEDSPRGSLALIILLDQFSRNIYRGTAMAFSQDKSALYLCLRGIEKGFDTSLTPIERIFFYMPLMHSEDIKIQEKSLQYLSKLENIYPLHGSVGDIISGTSKYAKKHYEIIERFGRFPHRNKILGRESTPEEIEFLEDSGASF